MLSSFSLFIPRFPGSMNFPLLPCPRSFKQIGCIFYFLPKNFLKQSCFYFYTSAVYHKFLFKQCLRLYLLSQNSVMLNFDHFWKNSWHCTLLNIVLRASCALIFTKTEVDTFIEQMQKLRSRDSNFSDSHSRLLPNLHSPCYVAF